jgi:hypothetical protein
MNLHASDNVKVLIWQSSGSTVSVTGSFSLEWVAPAP